MKLQDKGFFRYWILFILIVWLLAGCGKGEIGSIDYKYSHYQLRSDWYTLDTIYMNRSYVQDFDSVWKQETKDMFDNYHVKWWTICGTDQFPLHLEKEYVIKKTKP